MITHEDKLKEYATLLIRVGLHIEDGMELMIHAPVDAADFARLCVDAAYDAGAKEVTVIWKDDYVTRARFLRAADEVFESVPLWRQELMNGKARAGVPHLFIEATDPMNLADAAPERLLANAKASGRDLEEFRRLETTSFFPLVHRIGTHPKLGRQSLSGQGKQYGAPVGCHFRSCPRDG